MALPPILVELKANSTSFIAGMRGAQAEVQKLGTESSAHMQKFAAVGKAALFGIGAAAVGIGVVSVKMGSDFQSAMELIHTQAGASQGEVNKMSQAVLGLAGKTATAPNELAAGLYHLESAGLRGSTALHALQIAAEGAKIGHADLESVTNALNAVLASGVKGAGNMSGAMGMLNATVGAGDMRMQDLADAMGTGVLTVAKNFGVSLNDVGAALAVFGDNNIRGADAATKLSQAITYMEKPAASADKVFRTFGMTSKQLRDDIGKGGLGLALTDLHDHLTRAGITGTQVGPILLDAFGRKPAGAINTLLGQYDRFNSKLDEVHKGANSFGADWNATQETMAFKAQKLGAEAEALGVKIGLALIPVLERAAAVTMDVVSWFEKHKTIAEALGVVVGGALVVAVGAYTVTMIGAAAATIAATWPILAVVAAAGLLGYGILELVRHWSSAWGAIKDAASAAWHFLDSDVFQPIRRAFDDVAGWVSSAVHTTVHVLETWGPLALAVLVPFIGIPLLIAQHFDAIAGFMSSAFGKAKSAIIAATRDVLNFVKGIPGMIVAAIGDLGGLLFNAGRQLLEGLGNGIKSAIGDAVGAAKGAGSAVLSGVKGIFGIHSPSTVFHEIGVNVIQGFVNGIESMSAKVRDTIGSFTAHAHDVMFGGGKAVADALVKGLDTVDAQLKTKLAGIVSQLASVKASATQMRDSISSSLSSAASLSSQPGTTDAAGNPVGPDTSVTGVTSYLTSSLAALQQFQGDLAALARKGLSADQINQIAQMGVTKGDQYAQSFLGANAAQIRQLNSLDTQIQKVSTGIGTLVSNDTFGTQITALTKEERQAAASMKAVEKAIAELVAEAKKKKPAELHVHIDGNLYGVSSKQFIKEVRDGLLTYRRTSGQSLGFT